MEAATDSTGPALLERVMAVLAGHAPELARDFGVSELSVFGSVTRGEARAESDIDILVDFEPAARIGLLEFVKLQDHLAMLLGRRVDLVMRSGVRRQLRDRIFAEALRVA